MSSDDEPVGGVGVPDGPVSIEFRNLHFAYAHGSFGLDDISLDIPAGTTCALVGRSGSGKSTLASLLSRAVDPEPGTVLLAGVDVLDLELDELRATVGLVTQRTEIIAGTLADNIAMFADIDPIASRPPSTNWVFVAGSTVCRPGSTPCSDRPEPRCRQESSNWSRSPGSSSVMCG